MEVLHERCAGLDVHKDTVVVCVRLARGKRADRTIKTFGTTTTELFQLSDWLKEHETTVVAMEATGVYWKPVWHILEDSFELILANAAHIKNVPGRKTDVKDAHWIADLLAHGLINSSFVPPTFIMDLRSLTRTRKQLVQERSRHVQRVEKVLQEGNIKVSSAISDIMGKSGRSFLQALAEGETDPEELVKLAHPRLKAPRRQLIEALRGFTTSHHRFMLRTHLRLIDGLNAAIESIEREVEAQLEPFREQVELLVTMPGLSKRSASTVLAEIGADMSRFPTASHLVSWAGLCPRCDESAGKRRSTRTLKGNRWLKSMLIQCAWAAVRKKNSHFKSLYHRIRARRGSKKAIVAVAAEMLRSIWHMLKKNESYREPTQQEQNEGRRGRRAKALVRQLKKLGYEASIEKMAA